MDTGSDKKYSEPRNFKGISNFLYTKQNAPKIMCWGSHNENHQNLGFQVFIFEA